MCIDCNARTSITQNDLIQRLIDLPFEKLRKGIPSLSFNYSLEGSFRTSMYFENRGIFAGYGDERYPLTIKDLQKLFLISINLWKILYSVEGCLGTFIWLNKSSNQILFPEELDEYFDQSFFQFIGQHEPSMNNILILSPEERFYHPSFIKTDELKEKINKDQKFIDKTENSAYKEFRNCAWNLFFYNDGKIFIIPQKKSILDVGVKMI